MEIDYSSYLPAPTPLRHSAVIEFTWGSEQHRMLVVAADVRTEKWETGVDVTWLHCKGIQVHRELPNVGEVQSTMTLMVPASYLTSIENGPAYRVAKGHQAEDIGVFPPEHADPPNSLGTVIVQQKIADLLSPERN